MKVGCRSKEKKEGNICVPRPGCYIKKGDNALPINITWAKNRTNPKCKKIIDNLIYADEGGESDEKCEEQAQEWENECDIKQTNTFGYEFIG